MALFFFISIYKMLSSGGDEMRQKNEFFHFLLISR